MPRQTPDSTVEVVDHDPAWAAMFEQERRLLLTARPTLVAVEHIGSTAVPGLAAKPTIDLLAVVADEELAAARLAVEGLGYIWVPESFADDPRHQFLHRLRNHKRTHHLHVLAASSPLVARYLLFRDYLRAHPDEAARYADFKLDLADRYAADRDRYIDSKPPFVDAMIERAWRWHDSYHGRAR